jgi:hypothetical protein
MEARDGWRCTLFGSAILALTISSRSIAASAIAPRSCRLSALSRLGVEAKTRVLDLALRRRRHRGLRRAWAGSRLNHVEKPAA